MLSGSTSFALKLDSEDEKYSLIPTLTPGKGRQNKDRIQSLMGTGIISVKYVITAGLKMELFIINWNAILEFHYS